MYSINSMHILALSNILNDTKLNRGQMMQQKISQVFPQPRIRITYTTHIIHQSTLPNHYLTST